MIGIFWFFIFLLLVTVFALPTWSDTRERWVYRRGGGLCDAPSGGVCRSSYSGLPAGTAGQRVAMGRGANKGGLISLSRWGSDVLRRYSVRPCHRTKVGGLDFCAKR